MDKHNIRVLVVDDHRLFREGLSALLNASQGVDVAGEAATGEDIHVPQPVTQDR